ncbi:hypothetical protein XA68_11508 [Ophiocordyceps unilateralis]|uniref:PinX1-related protein 1 n=1 Tax=Ophiocordyceps unilateralis TaxID=268505 RepID=A0A2A9PF92_OPHUN|nr:hypothetical protein XA68_11508 [Ophiocordyceps unilateralis]
MGMLAESKRGRRKMSRDPNNTRWMRDESTFGQKILRGQGWEPGQPLGAQNTWTSKLGGVEKASLIRVSLKDDVKGLGYNKAQEDKVTGLDVFSDVLSRLNGKSEEDIEKKRQDRQVLETNLYVQQRWGVVRFVRGGLLAGDIPEKATASQTQEKEKGYTASDGEKAEEGQVKTELAGKASRSKKRKLADIDTGISSSREERKRRKEEKKVRKASSKAAHDSQNSGIRAMGRVSSRERCCGSEEVEGNAPADKPRKKSKLKEKARRRRSADETQSTGDRKEKTDDKKKKRRRHKAEAEAEAETEAKSTEPEASETKAQATPTEPNGGTCTPNGHRNFVRSRFIAAKRQAMLDPQALNQIFMIKT